MILPNKKTTILIALLLLNSPIAYPADIHIHFNLPTAEYSKNRYGDLPHNIKLYKQLLRQNLKQRHQRRQLRLNSYPHVTKNSYADLIQKHYRHNYRHPAIEPGYHDYQRRRYHQRHQQKQTSQILK